MKIDIKDIRQRLSNNTAIDKEEIEALCDEAERSEWENMGSYELMEVLKESNQILRSMHAITERKGLGTNWEAFSSELNKVLEKQHIVIHGGGLPKAH